MKMDKNQIFEKFRETVNLQNLFLIDISFRGDGKNRIIEVFIDGEKGITPVECASVSHELNTIIEEENLIESNYRLDVSSPGVDRPLKFIEQYPKHINRKFEVVYSQGEETVKFKGVLKEIDGDNLIFSEGKNERRIKFTTIQKANVLISF